MQFSTDKLDATTKPFQFFTAKGVTAFRMKLNWESAYDIDLSVFGLKADGKIDENLFGYVLFYFWLEQHKAGADVSSMIRIHPDKTYETLDGALIHSSDIKNGSAQGDDEWVIVTPAKLAPSIETLAVVASIHGNGSFGGVKNTVFSIENAQTNETIQHYNLTKEFSTAKIIVLGELHKREGIWEFQPIGDAHAQANLDAALRAYGVPL